MCKDEEEVKGQLSSCYQEHGRLETEAKVRRISLSRDVANIAANSLVIVGGQQLQRYSTKPFSSPLPSLHTPLLTISPPSSCHTPPSSRHTFPPALPLPYPVSPQEGGIKGQKNHFLGNTAEACWLRGRTLCSPGSERVPLPGGHTQTTA